MSKDVLLKNDSLADHFNIDDLHNVQYQILLEFDRVCKKFGLTYFLAYGTLLGAIRHDGFIPWDDDIDTLMPYDDYIKLQKIPREEWNTPYFLQSHYSEKNCCFCFTKIRNTNTTLITDALAHMDINHGVDIDVYPLIHLADDRKARKKQYRKTMLYMLLRLNEPPRNHGKILYLSGKLILGLIPDSLRKQILVKLNKEITAYQSVNTRDSYVVNGNVEVMRQTLKNKWFSKSVDHLFEGRNFPVPVGAKAWLKIRYGSDYMQMPPKELQGIKLDHFVKVDLETSYKKYKGKYYCSKDNKRTQVKNDRWVKYS